MTERGDGASTEASPYDEWIELRAGAAGLVAGFGAFFLVRYLSIDGGLSLLPKFTELPFFLLSLSLLYAGYWLLRSDFGSLRVGRIAAWSAAGFLVLVAIAVWVGAGQSNPLQRSVLLTLDVGAVGASSGLLIGLENERRQCQVDRNAIAATHAAERAEERFAFFNRLLRHHLLNGVAVVRGHAEQLSTVQDDPPEEVRIIRRRSDEIVALVRNVDTLARAFTGELPREPIDPVPPLRDAVQTIHREHPMAEVLLDGEEGTRVMANERIGLAFEAILRIAVEAAGDEPVSVTAGDEDGTVVVSFEFEGAVPRGAAPLRDRVVHGDENLGLFLAETLIEHFGGAITVPAGDRTGISVWLPRSV